MLILLVIAAVWFVVACLVVAACRSAASGDAAMAQAAQQVERRATLAGVVLWETPDPVSAGDLRGSRAGRAGARRTRVRSLAS